LKAVIAKAGLESAEARSSCGLSPGSKPDRSTLRTGGPFHGGRGPMAFFSICFTQQGSINFSSSDAASVWMSGGCCRSGSEPVSFLIKLSLIPILET